VKIVHSIDLACLHYVCSLQNQDIDEWCAGLVVKVVRTAVPHTELFLLAFDVQYCTPSTPAVAAASISSSNSASSSTLPSPPPPPPTALIAQHGTSVTSAAAGENTDVNVNVVDEKGVKSDRIRILAEADGTVPGFEFACPGEEGADAAAAVVPAPVIPKDENTGIGMWQTVAVREVDKEAELLALQESERLRELMFKAGGGDGADKNDVRHADNLPLLKCGSFCSFFVVLVLFGTCKKCVYTGLW
jgi:hypothetical protein